MTTQALQRLTSSPRSASIIIHVVGLVLFAASFSWLPNITNPQHHLFGGSFQFLTFISLTISALTFAVGFLADIFPTEQLFALKNTLSVCATPLEVLITILYWNVRAVDKGLVAPPGHELPLIPDLAYHAMPAVLLILDSMLLSARWSIKALDALMLYSVLAFSYWGWVEYCFSFNRSYPYPILTPLSTWQKLFLCIFLASVMTGSTMTLKWVYGRVNGLQQPSSPVLNSIKID